VSSRPVGNVSSAAISVPIAVSRFPDKKPAAFTPSAKYKYIYIDVIITINAFHLAGEKPSHCRRVWFEGIARGLSELKATKEKNTKRRNEPRLIISLAKRSSQSRCRRGVNRRIRRRARAVLANVSVRHNTRTSDMITSVRGLY